MALDFRRCDEAMFYVADTVKKVLHGEGGGPFPYSSKAAAFSAAANKNGRNKQRRFIVVSWITMKEVRS